jgi:N-methylhydantoinase A
VTDADLVSGRLIPEHFLGGAMRLHPERAARALTQLARRMKATPVVAARGVIRVVNANMERAIRVITVERGFDPRDFALLAFGGAGPMHACELALDLGIRHIVMPQNPGLLCAWGALGALLGRELSLTIREANPELRALERRARPLLARAHADLLANGAAPASIHHELWADLRYRGQSYEIEIQLGPHFLDHFHDRHRQTFGHAAPDAPVEVVNLRVRAAAHAPAVAPTRLTRLPRPTPLTRIPVILANATRTIPVYARDGLGAGARLNGPLIVVELSATSYVAPEFAVRADDYGNLHLELR